MGTYEMRTVLLVEDDKGIREIFTEILEMAGYAARSSANGQEALFLLRGGYVRPDLILLDLLMPVMDGWEFRDRQRADPDLASIPVVVVSTCPTHGRALDVAQLVCKPSSGEQLLRVVARHCRNPFRVPGGYGHLLATGRPR